MALDVGSLKSACKSRGYKLKGSQPVAGGGMSQIWLAKDSKGKEVAIKVPVGSPEAIERLEFEINVLSKLDHEYIIKYEDSFKVYGLPILVMEYVKGPNLELQVAGRPLDESEALKETVKVLLAVDYIHSMGVIHRDLKPKNVIRAENDLLKLLDFGTAAYLHYVGIREAVISPGGYTPPEQYNYMASPQGDIWSVGAILYFLLTGQHPVIGMPGYPRNPCPPPDPRKMNRDVSEDAAKAVMKAMEWEPSKRFPTALDMINFIEGRVPSPASATPTISVFGERIPIETSKLVFGRLVEGGSTYVERIMPTQEGPAKVRVHKEGDVTYVFIRDPYKWISRRHFEIYESEGKWYIRDLGSLNRTAVYYGGKLNELWVGHGKPSPPQELQRGSLIYVAYGSSLTANSQAYVVVTFR